MTKENEKGISIYLIVFGVLIAIIVVAALSTALFNKSALPSGAATANNLSDFGPAAQITGVTAWINSPPLTISQLKGKVVLVDFWTYSCINCIRTIPFLNALQSEYGSNGLVIIGVSTPEFAFEHNYTNVLDAVKRFNITYAVALDNNYATWDAFGNEYWPADYLIDKNGDIRYESFGEGPSNFNQTQQAIRELLEGANYSVPSSVATVNDALNFSQGISPEMYLGYQELEQGRTNYFGNSKGISPNAPSNYTITDISQLQPDTIYLSGEWYSAQDSIIAVNNSMLYLVYRAKDVNIVASGNGNSSTISVTIDGKNLNQSSIGSDDVLANGIAKATINESRLYNIVSAPSYGVHILEINASKGFRIYTFTFG